ncbi:MAG: hypothetical protein U9N39_08005 [Campylobacterota bacterium]|nr:hypothetical protein [Campylobacterota bacterium]
MNTITLASLRDSATFFNIDDIVTIVNGRKKEEIGYFVPKSLKKEFEKFTLELERKRKIELLKRISQADKKDPVGDGAVDDGL